jgi:hypothetical protein
MSVPAAVQAHHRFDGFQFARAVDEALIGGEFDDLVRHCSVDP